MKLRLPVLLSVSVLALSSAFAGFVSQPTDGQTQRVLENPEPSKRAEPSKAPASEPAKPQTAEKNKPAPFALGNDKKELGRLIGTLQRSPRSFVYLRSIGYTETDQEFEQIIAVNSAIFRPTRIVRQDEQGKRVIPGWPGITLKQEYKLAQR